MGWMRIFPAGSPVGGWKAASRHSAPPKLLQQLVAIYSTLLSAKLLQQRLQHITGIRQAPEKVLQVNDCLLVMSAEEIPWQRRFIWQYQYRRIVFIDLLQSEDVRGRRRRCAVYSYFRNEFIFASRAQGKEA